VWTSASVVVLPPLPRAAHRVLQSHNDRTLQVFSDYTMAYASRYEETLGADRSLPLSGEVIAPIAESVPFMERLRNYNVPVIGRSVFVANSGHGDDFASVEDLERTTRPGLHLNKSVIPYVQLAADTGNFSLNAVLYDYFVHGSDDTLVVANGIKRGEVWYILNDFMLVLVTLQTSLELLFRQGIKDANLDAEGGDSYEPPTIDDDIEDRRGYFEEREGVKGVSEAFPQRPSVVPEGDWDVYRTVVAVRNEFETKFKLMWA